LAVDFGRVQLAKTELQRSADAAARAAAGTLAQGISAARAAANSIAYANLVDGTHHVLATSDIEFGNWNETTHKFTVATSATLNSADAVRVTTGSTAARENAIPLLFAELMGQNTCDIHASAVATV